MESANSNPSTVGNKVNCGTTKPREDRRVKCPVCDKVFKFGFSTSKIWSHLSSSHKIQKYNFLCFMCAQIFPALRLLNIHQKNGHADGAKHKCLICGKMATSVEDLKEHMDKRHRDFKRRYVDCRLCRRYIRTKDFFTHLQEKHVENIQGEIQSSLSKRKRGSETMKNPILKNIPEALVDAAGSTQPVVKAEVGQIEIPVIPAKNVCTEANSSPVFGIYEQFTKESSSHQTSLVDADTSDKSQTTLMSSFTVWEYSLDIRDSVLVTSPDGNGVWLEWILTLPDLLPPISK